MKAVVLEVRDGRAAVLREDGTVEKLRRDCRVGETIELADERRIVSLPKKAGRWAAAAAAALMLVSGGTYGYNNAYAYSFVTLDANPSIEYVLNRRNQIISVEALNDAAADIVQALEEAGVRRASISDVIGETTELLYEADYLGGERDNCLLISVSSRGEAQREALEEELGGYFTGRGGELTVYVTDATRGEAREAERLGMSTGRYRLIEDIVGPEGMTDDDAYRFDGASVGELMEERGLRPAPEESGPQTSGEPETAVETPMTEARGRDAEAQGAQMPDAPQAEPRQGWQPPQGQEEGRPDDPSGEPGGVSSGEPSR